MNALLTLSLFLFFIYFSFSFIKVHQLQIYLSHYSPGQQFLLIERADYACTITEFLADGLLFSMNLITSPLHGGHRI